METSIFGPPLLRIPAVIINMPPSLSFPLPSLKDFIDSLFDSLKAHPDTALDVASKSTLLTLHALFPSLLLPALDLLDRRLVTRFVLKVEDRNNHEATETRGSPTLEPNEQGEHGTTQTPRIIYYVQSSASSHSDRRSRHAKTADVASTHYEVRPHAWSCTCAAFAFSAYNVPSSFSPAYASYEDLSLYDRRQGHGYGVKSQEKETISGFPEGNTEAGRRAYKQLNGGWGGLMLGKGEVPLCKHLLACALAERWRVAAEMNENRLAGSEEIAGWGAGWGG